MKESKQFSYQDIEDYYDQTEIHYRMWWNLEKSMGLHYGVWDESTKSSTESIINLNRWLAKLGNIQEGDKILDAGCGIGGSSIHLAKQLNCDCIGITLSEKQVKTATQLAKANGVQDKCQFARMSYTETKFSDQSFDNVWAIESVGSAQNKADFFKEMHRLLKTEGRILLADTLKPEAYDIAQYKDMQVMLNGWAISDILSIEEMEVLAKENGFKLVAKRDVSDNIKKSVQKIWVASLMGKIGSKIYNFFNKNTSYFASIHYKTGIAQKKTYDRGEWKYMLMVFEKV